MNIKKQDIELIEYTVVHTSPLAALHYRPGVISAKFKCKHRCQPSRNRAGNPANLVVSRIPAFFPKHPAFLGFFGGETNSR